MTAALLDHLWQSTLFAAVIWLMMPLFRNNSASLRFRLWFAASMKFLLPFSIFATAGHYLLPPVAPHIGPELVSALRPIAIPFAQQARPFAGPVAPHLPLMGLALAVWLLGAIGVVARWLVHSRQLRTHLIGAAELPLAAPVPVKSARSCLEPGILGILRPVILLPDGIAESLSPVEIEAVMAHEVCHLRRRDNLLAALHMLVQALFWFHPLVWWLGDRLVEERELACDEAVLAAGNQPLVYAQSLLKICRAYIQSPLACAAGVSGATLETRIGAILENRAAADMGEAKRALLLSGAALTVILPLLAGGMAPAAVAHIATHIVSTIVANATPASIAVVPDIWKPEPRPAAHRRRRTPVVQPVVADRIAAPSPDEMISRDAKVAVAAPAVPEPDRQIAPADASARISTQDATAIVCRPPQQLPGSRLIGPRVCRSDQEWARLQQQGEDIGADGHSIVEVRNRSPFSQPCIPTLAATYSNTGIVCF